MQREDEIFTLPIPTPFPVGDVNCYVLRTETETILIDCGPDTEEAWQAMQHGLLNIGLTVSMLDKVIVTHHHADHAGLAYRFSEQGIPVYGHARLRPYLEQDQSFLSQGDAFLQRLALSFGVPEEIRALLPSYISALKWLGKGQLDHLLQEGDSISASGRYRVIELPGHASDQIGILSQSGVLFAADHLLARVEPNPLLEQPQPGDTSDTKRPVLAYMRSLRKLQGEQIQIAYTGHGEAIRDVPSLIEERLLQRKARGEQLLKHITGEQTLFELAQLTYGNRLKKSFPLVMSEMKARLDYLVASGQITVIKRDNVLRYTRKGALT
ncbi:MULTISPECIES: MBL fold metallo-hydrolase [Exiguobacterium]|uniref:MBL fold metallo-hydrolase n=1 Tax=Exiguobacterium antarcticum TaxID=132920 RepID=A0ABT6R187_9BACL|nr:MULTISPECIES: MBL fold metallo-hydrolase [Exiguobacterium]AFS70099.1 beta-lactamase domain-containing protein [Exiguobacterium antarcticum B7]MCT4781238.1 MBL fold metallo-hydrolase [Exiguobacterium soli]MDI3234713.1 MBL fold metallo-hydrolase [Exiguobacterium antarcticum]